MRHVPKSQRRLGVKKETLRTLNADELLLAGGGWGGTGTTTQANSLSGSRKCGTSGDCAPL